MGRILPFLTEFILLKRNVKLIMLHFFGLEVPECCLWISNKGKPPLSLCHLINESSVLLATPRGQGRGRTVIPGFAVRYISIMLPSQTRHLVCQSQTVVLPSPLPIFLHMRWRAEHSIWPAAGYQRRGDNFFLPCLACSIFLFWFKVASHSTTGTEARRLLPPYVQAKNI